MVKTWYLTISSFAQCKHLLPAIQILESIRNHAVHSIKVTCYSASSNCLLLLWYISFARFGWWLQIYNVQCVHLDEENKIGCLQKPTLLANQIIYLTMNILVLTCTVVTKRERVSKSWSWCHLAMILTFDMLDAKW